MPGESYKQQFAWTTSQLADDKIEAPRVDLRNRNTMIVGFLLTLNARNSLGKDLNDLRVFGHVLVTVPKFCGRSRL